MKELDKFDPSLQVITDRLAVGKRPLELIIEQTILGGATMIQLRMKDSPTQDLIVVGQAIHQITKKHNIPLIVNDNLQVCLVIGAEGLHIGQQDLSAGEARQRLGSDKILGVSVSNVAEALKAERDGADYLGVGPIFATPTKKDAGEPIGLERLREIVQAVSLPVVGIGGITVSNAGSVIEVGASGIAVISAVMGAADPEKATRELKLVIGN